MNITKDLKSVTPEQRNAVIAIGNFDGVHRGHQALLQRARSIANEKKTSLAVLTFEPHPHRLFHPDEPPSRITPEAVKARRLESCGVDHLISLPFTWDFASQSAEEFVQRILKDSLAASHIIIGSDFRFGQLRKGDAKTLERAGLPVTALKKIQSGDSDISSSAIRQALRRGDIAQANDLLGWEWEIEGTVFRGDRRGHELGYPTANILLGETLHPAYGVYASHVRIVEDGPDAPWLPAATNIGIRPMFEVAQGQVEAHIFDFNDRDIYAKTIRVKPVAHLRGEAKFRNVDDLIVQIEDDCKKIRTLLLIVAQGRDSPAT